MIQLKCYGPCGKTKDSTDFSKLSSSPRGFQYKCKKCESEYRKENKERYKIQHKLYNENNRNKIKIQKAEYYIKNKDVIDERNNNWHKNNKEKEKAQKHKYYKENKQKIDSRNKQWQKNNPEKIAAIVRKYRAAHPEVRIALNLRRRLKYALLHDLSKRITEFEELHGCTRIFLKNYIESLWTEGMNWDNYSYRGWHIDHIKPCCSFNLVDPEQQKLCFHYSNLRPFWGTDNFKKINEDKKLSINKKI